MESACNIDRSPLGRDTSIVAATSDTEAATLTLKLDVVTDADGDSQRH